MFFLSSLTLEYLWILEIHLKLFQKQYNSLIKKVSQSAPNDHRTEQTQVFQSAPNYHLNLLV